MAYADNLLTATASLTTAASLITGLCSAYSSASGSLQNTTSTSLTNMTSASISLTVNTGEIVVLGAVISCSHSSATGETHFVFTEDAVAFGQTIKLINRAGAVTSGYGDSAVLLDIRAPSATTHTYRIQWKVTSGTGYSADFKFIGFTLQNT